VNAQMEHALRVISVERGYDPRDFSLFSFGGAGGLHATELARHMGISKVIISKYASTLSALGMLSSNIIKDYVKTVMLPGDVNRETLNELFSTLINQGTHEVESEGISPRSIELQTSMDVRFSGQSYELTVPYSDRFITDFHAAHRLSYGYTYETKPVEIVNLRLRAIGKIKPIDLPSIKPKNLTSLPQPIKIQHVELTSDSLELPVFNYETLYAGYELAGPALIVSPDTTILIDKNDVVHVDEYQNLSIDVCLEY
jgi:N-methylhydantoinase A